jgi:hypothetical protein
MELNINLNYNQILKLIYQLPESEIKRLAKTLQTDVLTKKKINSIQELLLDGPTWTESDIEDYQSARKSLTY